MTTLYLERNESQASAAFIDGRWITQTGITADVIGSAPGLGAEETRTAIVAAKRAFPL